MSVSCMEYCVILYVKDNLINILFPVVAIVPYNSSEFSWIVDKGCFKK
jgi:hypothetical protein